MTTTADLDVIDAWLVGRTPNTRRAYNAAVDSWLTWCEQQPAGVPILAPLVEHCRSYHEHWKARSRSNDTVRSRCSAVSSLIDFALLRGATPAGYVNPWPQVGIVPGSKVSNTPYLEPDQLAQLLGWASVNAGAPEYALLRLCGVLALRVDAAVSFRLDALEQGPHGWRYRFRAKGGADLTKPVDDETVDAIRAAAGDRTSGLLFPNERDPDRPMDQTTARRRVAELCAAAGVPIVKPHGLRHSSITGAIRATGGDRAAGQAHAGHASIETTARYDRRADLDTAALDALTSTLRGTR